MLAAVRADDAHDAVARQREGEIVDQDLLAEGLAEVVDLDDHAAQARARRDLDLLEVQLPHLVGLGRHLLVPGETGLGLGLAALGVGADPLQLFLEPLGALGVLLALDLETGLLALQVRGVVALVADRSAAVELQDPARDVVEEVPVVGDRDDGAGVLREVLLQPLHGLGVQVVGGLVEQQQVGGFEQQLAQRDAATLTTGQVGDGPVAGRAAQGVHGLLQLGVQVPRVRVVQVLLELAHLVQERVRVVGRHELRDLVEAPELAHDLGGAVLHVLQDRLGLVQRRLLLEHTDGVAGRQERVTVGGLLDARHDLENGGLTGTVRTDHTDLRAGQEAQRDVVKDHLVAVRLACLAHRVDVLSQEKPSGNLKSGSGQYHPSCRTATPRRKPDGEAPGRATRPGALGAYRGRVVRTCQRAVTHC